MKYQYIAIEREYGSGGQEIAEQIAKASGIPYFGHQILERVARDMDLSPDQIEDCEERATNSLLYSLYAMAQIQAGAYDMLPLEGKVHLAEQELIRDLASYGQAVFLGHCAAEALRGRNGVLRVFIRSDEKQKVERIRDLYGIKETNINKMIRKYDQKRANYYYANTSRKWRSPDNYDMILDSGTLGTKQCAELLLYMLREH